MGIISLSKGSFQAARTVCFFQQATKKQCSFGSIKLDYDAAEDSAARK